MDLENASLKELLTIIVNASVAARAKAEQELAGQEIQAGMVQAVEQIAAQGQEALNAIPDQQVMPPQGPGAPTPAATE